MRPKIIHLDDKWRLPIPTEDRIHFPEHICYGSLRTHSILLGPKSTRGIPVEYQKEFDESSRILIGRDLLNIIGITPNEDSSKNEVLWIPRSVNDSISFLLFFGPEGKATWRNILATKTAVTPLVH